MCRVQDIYNSINQIAPFDTAMDYDNVGLLVGDMGQKLTRVLLCLDITHAVVAEAKSLGAQLILSHHPVIFHPLRAVQADSVVYSLIEANIAALGCHTNLDLCGDWGVNCALNQQLRLQNFTRLTGLPLFTADLPSPMEAPALGQYIKQALGAQVAYSKGHVGKIAHIALCSGAGGDYIYTLPQGITALITGEAQQDQWIEAKRRGIALFAAGHYETEQGFARLLQQYLVGKHKGVVFTLSQSQESPLSYTV